jgi:restriction endonuclease Mrr
LPDPTPEAVAIWIEQSATNLEFRPLRDVVQQVLATRLAAVSEESVAELAERLSSSVAIRIENRVAENRADGVVHRIEISTDVTAVYVKALESPELDLLKDLRRLKPARFEHFCADIFRGLRAEASVKGGTDDRGVDFIARGLQLGGNIDPSPISSRALVIGQAKRYGEGNNITETQLRAFIGGALLDAERLRREHAGILTPVTFAYWTTSDFHPLARKYAREMGLWYLKGIGVAQLALRASPNVQFTADCFETTTKNAQ